MIGWTLIVRRVINLIENLKFTITLRKTLIGYISFWLSHFLIRFMKNEQKVINIINKLICNDRVYRMKIIDGDWKPLDLSVYEFTLSDNE